jgi:hypothetical protein
MGGICTDVGNGFECYCFCNWCNSFPPGPCDGVGAKSNVTIITTIK